MKLMLKDNFAFDCKTIEIGRDGDVGAVEVEADFGAAGTRYEAVRFEFADMLGKRFRTKTFRMPEDKIITFPLPAEATDTVGTVEFQAVLLAENAVRKTNVITFEVMESVNAEDASVADTGNYCPMMRFRIDRNGELSLAVADESAVIGHRWENGDLVVRFPARYDIREAGVAKNGEATLKIELEVKQ